MTIPPQLLMMLPSLLGGLGGGQKEGNGGLMAPPPPNLLPNTPPPNFGGGLMGPAGQMMGMNPGFQMGAIPGLMGMMGRSPSPLFGLGLGPGMMRALF